MYIDEALYRDIYHKYLYIECKDALKDLGEAIEVIPEATGILTYCYVEDMVGLSFHVLASAKKTEDGKLELGPISPDYIRIRFADVQYYDYEMAEDLGVDVAPYADFAKQIYAALESGDEKISKLRELTMIDHARNLERPDYISVSVQKPGYLPEMLWVRVEDFGEDVFFGTLAQQPSQDLGLKPNDQIPFRAYDTGESIVFFHDPLYGKSEEELQAMLDEVNAKKEAEAAKEQ